MCAMGFSCPSTVPVFNARYTSVTGIGTGLAPNSRNACKCAGFGVVRILRPFTSSGTFTGRLLFVRLRKPISRTPTGCRPCLVRFCRNSLPIGPSITL